MKSFLVEPPISSSLYSGNYTEDMTLWTPITMDVQGEERSYYLYVPKSYNGQKMPALVLLHGDKRTGVSMIEHWRSIAEREGIILIAPNGKNQTWSEANDGSVFFVTLIKDVSSSYALDPDRLYLFGHSRGAIHSLYMSILYSEVFAATALHAGKLYDSSHYAYIDQAQRKIPIAFIVGSHDHVFPLDAVQDSAKAFAERGHEIELHVLKEHTHWYYDIASFINKRAWQFLSRHQKEAAPTLAQ